VNERKQKILIVDDTPLNIKILGEVLRDDYTIMVATNGVKALQLANSDAAPDLILLDVMMPDSDNQKQQPDHWGRKSGLTNCH